MYVSWQSWNFIWDQLEYLVAYLIMFFILKDRWKSSPVVETIRFFFSLITWNLMLSPQTGYFSLHYWPRPKLRKRSHLRFFLPLFFFLSSWNSSKTCPGVLLKFVMLWKVIFVSSENQEQNAECWQILGYL